jgi:signal transduction histidine kinase
MFLLIVARTQGLTREVTVQDERRRLLGRVLQAAEDERTRIAHDLHDGPVQQLAVLNYDVYRARKRISDLLGQVSGDALMQDLQRADEVLEGVEKGLGEVVPRREAGFRVQLTAANTASRSTSC